MVELKPLTDHVSPVTCVVVPGTGGNAVQVTAGVPANFSTAGILWPSFSINEYLLIITDPGGGPDTIYALNNNPATPPWHLLVVPLDYTFQVSIKTGATVKLTVRCIDNAAIPNPAGSQADLAVADPSTLNVPLSTFSGQFLQMDVLSVGGSSPVGLPFQVNWTFTPDATVGNYSITNTGNNYPTDWTLEGSNDGTAWTLLDERTGLAFVNGQTLKFPIEFPASYQYYRLTVTATSDNAAPSLGTPNLYAAAPSQVCQSAQGTGTTQDAADFAASSAANTAALALLNCAAVYSSTQSYDSGGTTYSATALSFNSQQEADAAALALAKAQVP